MEHRMTFLLDVENERKSSKIFIFYYKNALEHIFDIFMVTWGAWLARKS